MNGAGKSTTFKMLTEELDPTSGHFRLAAGTRIGYCPQADALDPNLTVREQLEVFGRIRGLRANLSKVSPVARSRHDHAQTALSILW
jgi:ABC-type multidrug transport system ATPase subunit